VIIFPLIVCKKTRAEALAYREAIVSHPDSGSIEKYFARHKAGDAHGWKQHDASDRILGGHLQITGSPEDVADAIERLKEAGFDGIQIGFYDYGPDLDFFAEHVQPLLAARGLRA
jgi:FMNH2-dependent dimethyl sulfone monooxygenase